MEWLFIALYLASCVAAFFLLCDAWRMEYDMSVGDMAFMAFLSWLGPVSAMAASVIWIIAWLDNRPYKEHKAIWRKKCK